jgi:hypothetical protein
MLISTDVFFDVAPPSNANPGLLANKYKDRF